NDRFAVLWRQPDLARQRQQAERFFQIDVVRRQTFRNAGAFGLLDFGLLLAFFHLGRLHLFAELEIGAEAAAAQGHFEPCLRVFAQHLLALYAIGAGRDLPCEIAVRIVRAADEGAEAPGLERQFAGPALRALPARLAVRALGEDVRFQEIVERIEHDAIAN